MSRIVAGRFDQMSAADAVLKALPDAGFQRSEFEFFFVTPPGQHATYPVGGDVHSDEGARHAGSGAMRGVLVGGAIGLAAGIAGFMVFDQLIVILAGVGIGAYVGSLLGALSKTRAGRPGRATVEHPVERASGHMVAVLADRPGAEQRAAEILQRHGAKDIERTEGEWRDGDWKDFDPRTPAPADKGVPTKSVASKVLDAGQPKQR